MASGIPFNGQSEFVTKKGRIISPLRHQTALDVLKNIGRQKQNALNFQDYDDQPLFQQMEKRNNVFKIQMNSIKNGDQSFKKGGLNIIKDSTGDIFIQQQHSQVPKRNQSVADSYNIQDSYDKSIVNRRNQSVNYNKQESGNSCISTIFNSGYNSQENNIYKNIKTEKTEYDSPQSNGSPNNLMEQNDILDSIAINGIQNNSEFNKNISSKNKTVPLQNIMENNKNLNDFDQTNKDDSQNQSQYDQSIRKIYKTNVMSNDLYGYNQSLNLNNYNLPSIAKQNLSKSINNQSNYIGVLQTEESNIQSKQIQQQSESQNPQIKSRSTTMDTASYLQSLHSYQQKYLNPQQNPPDINLSPDKIAFKQYEKLSRNDKMNIEDITPQQENVNFASPVKKSIQLKRQQIQQEKDELSKLYEQYLVNAKQDEDFKKNQINNSGNYFVTSLKGKSFNINIISQIPKNINSPNIESQLKTKVYLQNKEYKSISPLRQQIQSVERWK
ncbi:hypothetical protein TTHERM_00316450 (macronuclear) [Tetrahymena thermophila SB210]|uniref:Uncharacterized protein n=1 Tax=Tetrahymena thermophila (strain SB210) TaxID=312017 RepID=I7M983_TETTS|nr:hypothetical protein TTHERM_00316450 [Tetrahymena thermophila SB210]EAS01092.1 hypothetical protein TTHERM_00316450 [Tetrahymena thermophila SB210]|eukprot:XP_001021337.1 hypothetical protein TTHERM_00316450 [Tetrahymena thermophila SB210]